MCRFFLDPTPTAPTWPLGLFQQAVTCDTVYVLRAWWARLGSPFHMYRMLRQSDVLRARRAAAGIAEEHHNEQPVRTAHGFSSPRLSAHLRALEFAGTSARLACARCTEAHWTMAQEGEHHLTHSYLPHALHMPPARTHGTWVQRVASYSGLRTRGALFSPALRCVRLSKRAVWRWGRVCRSSPQMPWARAQQVRVNLGWAPTSLPISPCGRHSSKACAFTANARRTL